MCQADDARIGIVCWRSGSWAVCSDAYLSFADLSAIDGVAGGRSTACEGEVVGGYVGGLEEAASGEGALAGVDGGGDCSFIGG